LGIKSDQESTNPAIKAAAKAKAAKHKICKKKAAIKYLAGLGCSPEHPEVGPALIAAFKVQPALKQNPKVPRRRALRSFAEVKK
jgi:hypothetical protein